MKQKVIIPYYRENSINGIANTEVDSKKSDFLFQTPMNKGLKNLSISIEKTLYGSSFRKEPFQQSNNKSISKVSHHFFEKSKSKGKDSKKILLAENLETTFKANKERIKTLNSLSNKIEMEVTNLVTDTQNSKYKFFRQSETKKNNIRFQEDSIKITSLKMPLSKQGIHYFNIDNSKLIKTKIFKFCKGNKIIINEVYIY